MKPRHEAAEYRLLLRALAGGAVLDKYAAAKLLGIHHRNAAEYLKIVVAQREARVVAWLQTRRVGPYRPVISASPGESVTRPGSQEYLARRRPRGRILPERLLGL